MGLVMPKSASLTVRDELTRQFLGWDLRTEHSNLPPKNVFRERDIPAGDVPVDVLELGEVAESPGHVERHRGEAAVRDLVQVLPVSLVHQVASAEGGGNIFKVLSLMSNFDRSEFKMNSFSREIKAR